MQMLKNMRFVILFDIFLNPGFKMMTCFASAARTTNFASAASAVILYTRKDFKLSGIESSK